MVARVEPLIDRYPQRFPSIEHAKAFIKQQCELKNFNYNFSADTELLTKLQLMQKVHFIVAMKAFRDGEFYLDVQPPHGRELRRTYMFTSHAPCITC